MNVACAGKLCPMQETTGLDALRRVAIERLNWARGFTLAMVGDMADEQLLDRAGGRGNHAMWVLGHIAQSDDALLAALSGGPTQLPAAYGQLFGGGSEPSANLADYPKREDIIAAMTAARERLIVWLNSLDAPTAFAPTPEFLRRFAPDRITAALAIAAHEMLHNGQLTAIRSVLGLPRLIR